MGFMMWVGAAIISIILSFKNKHKTLRLFLKRKTTLGDFKKNLGKVKIRKISCFYEKYRHF